MTPHALCTSVFFPLLQESSKDANHSSRPEQSSNFNMKPTKITLAYPGINNGKFDPICMLAKNMYPNLKPHTELWKSWVPQCPQLPNLTPRTTPKYLVYPCLSYHTFAQHPTGNWQELRFKHQQFKEVNVDSTRFQDIYGYFRDARTASMHYHHYHYL